MEFLTLEIALLLFFVALVAGFVDTLAGGGGVITIPALMLTGMSPIQALGTNKLQAFMGSFTATFMMFRKKKVTFKEIKHLMLYAFMGSAIGTIFVQFIDAKILSFIIPIVLVVIGVYFIFMPTSSQVDTDEKMSQKNYGFFVVPAIGFYDGAIGPGTGSFLALSGVALRGYNLIKATINAKCMNFATNIASVIVFLAYGNVVIVMGVIMMIGQVIGAYFGSNTLFKINPNHLRVIVVFISFAMLIRYAYQMEWFF